MIPLWKDLGSARASPKRVYNKIKEGFDALESEVDAIVIYDDTALSGRVTTLEETTDLYSVTVNIPADTAASDEIETAIFVAPFKLDINSILISPDANIGQATNYMALFVNEYVLADGTHRQNLGLRSVNSTNVINKWQAVDIKAEPGNIVPAEAGNTLTFKKHPVETGQSWPGGSVTITFSKNNDP